MFACNFEDAPCSQESMAPSLRRWRLRAALIAIFSVLLMKAVGKVSQWTFLADDSPPFMVTAGARALAIALIALTFVFIDKSNYGWFGGAAAVCGVLLIVLIGSFDRVRKAHICKVPLLNEDGTQKTGWFGGKKFQTVVIGSENNMKTAAAANYQRLSAVSLCKFLSSYGLNEVNNAEAIWTKETLAKISSKMTLQLIGPALISAPIDRQDGKCSRTTRAVTV